LISKSELKVRIDTTYSENGHLEISIGKRHYLLLSKTLSERSPVPFTKKEVENLDKFAFMVVCEGAYGTKHMIYQVPILKVKEKMHENKGSDGKLDHWLDPKEYQEFKTLTINLE
jgi:hypothetical protein